MELHQNHSLLAYLFIPFPTAPPTNNINTCSQTENIRMFHHPNHILTHLPLNQKSHKLLLKRKIYRNSSHHLTISEEVNILNIITLRYPQHRKGTKQSFHNLHKTFSLISMPSVILSIHLPPLLSLSVLL